MSRAAGRALVAGTRGGGPVSMLEAERVAMLAGVGRRGSRPAGRHGDVRVAEAAVDVDGG